MEETPTVEAELQEALRSINEEHPAQMDPLPFLANIRHTCPKARGAKAGRGVSTAIQLHERYLEHEDEVHALVYREGTCKKCGSVARSSKGFVVVIEDRPPVYGRVGRE